MGIWNELEIHEIATVVFCLIVYVVAFVLFMLMERDRKRVFRDHISQLTKNKQWLKNRARGGRADDREGTHKREGE